MRKVTAGKMVATRRGTRVEQLVEAEESGGEQSSVEAVSPKRIRRPVQKYQSESYGGTSRDQGESAGSPIKADAPRARAATRSRHRSGQSDADTSEAESTTSNLSTRVTRSRPNLGGLTDSARKLRGCKPAVVNEPILESREDEALSETESNCSSVSTRARRTRASVSQPVRARSLRSALVSQLDSDHSEAESHCSSVSGLQNAAAKSRGLSEATHLHSHDGESQKDENSEAESLSSGFASQPLIKRSTRRIQYKLQTWEAKEASIAISPEQTSPKKQKSNICGVKVTEPRLPAQQQTVLSSPRRSLRSLRTRTVTQVSEVIVTSNASSRNKESSNEAKPLEGAEELEDQEKCDFVVEDNAEFESKLPEKSHAINSPHKVIDLIEDIMDVHNQCNAIEEDVVDGLKTDLPNLSKVSQSEPCSEPKSVKTREESEHSEAESNVEESFEQPELSDVEKEKETGEVLEHSEVKRDLEKAKNKSHKQSELSEDEDVEKEGEDRELSEVEEESHKQSELSEDDDDVEKEEESREQSEVSEDDVEMEESHVESARKPKPKGAPAGQDMAGGGLFVIDKAPGLDSSKKYYVDQEEDRRESVTEQSEEEEEASDNDEEGFIDEDDDDELLNRPRRGLVLSSSMDSGMSIKEMGGLYISFDAEKPIPGTSLLNRMKHGGKKGELLKKSVITPDFEKKESVPPYSESLSKLKKLRKEERAKTTGQGWFDMKAPEVTEELKNDLKALKMRSAMDPKRFYKKNDREGFPKYFQVGTVLDSPVDYYHSRIPKKQRKRTIVEELLADSEFRRYNKKKYQEIIAEKTARAEGKKNRKKKKFRT